MLPININGPRVQKAIALVERVGAFALSPWVLSTFVAVSICAGVAVVIAGAGYAEQYRYESAVYAAKQGSEEQLVEWRPDRRKRDQDREKLDTPEADNEPDRGRIRIIKDKPRWFDGSRLKSMGDACFVLAKGAAVLTLSVVGCILLIATATKWVARILFSIIGDLLGY